MAQEIEVKDQEELSSDQFRHAIKTLIAMLELNEAPINISKEDEVVAVLMSLEEFERLQLLSKLGERVYQERRESA